MNPPASLFLWTARLASILLVCGGLLLPMERIQAQSVFETESGHATFTSEVPSHSFTGSSDHLVGRINLDDSTVDFYVDLNTVETGISRRDRDMLQTLNAEEHPFAEFFGTLESEVDLEGGQPDSVTVVGEFSVNGVTREERIEGVLQRTDDGLYMAAEWTLYLDDYDIEPPGILFYRVDEEQDISIEAVLEPVDAAE